MQPDGEHRRADQAHRDHDQADATQRLHLPPHQQPGTSPDDHGRGHRIDDDRPGPSRARARWVAAGEMQPGEESPVREPARLIIGRACRNPPRLEAESGPPTAAFGLGLEDPIRRIADGDRIGVEPELSKKRGDAPGQAFSVRIFGGGAPPRRGTLWAVGGSRWLQIRRRVESSDRWRGAASRPSIRIGRDDLALVHRAQRPDDLHIRAVLEEADRAVAHQDVGTSRMAARHPEHARVLERVRGGR